MMTKSPQDRVRPPTPQGGRTPPADSAASPPAPADRIVEAILAQAQSRGLDPCLAAALVDRDVIYLDERGIVEGVDTALTLLLSSRPPGYLDPRRTYGGTPPRGAERLQGPGRGIWVDDDVKRALLATGKYSRM